MTEQKAKSGLLKKFIIALVLVIIVWLGFTAANYYFKYFGANVTDKQEYLYIPTGAKYEDVFKTIREQDMVKDSISFNWAATNMNYKTRVKPGKYRLHAGMSNRKLINMLASGTQEPVKLEFHGLRMKEQFAGFVAKKIEPDSVSIIRLLDSASYVAQFGFTTDNVYTVFMPNSYQLYWNTSPDKFFRKMYANYEKFWTPERKQQAAALNLSIQEVSVLASIVDAEALHDSDMPALAGLYLNRLKKGRHLDADPTVIFALNDFTIKRVLTRYLSYNSPYNTYLNKGLPPGPIMMPSVAAVKAVLNYQKNDYLYMCAKADFSGYHAFATNVADHLVNAHKFQQALNERNIRR